MDELRHRESENLLEEVAQECVQDQDKDEEHSQGERSEASIPIHQRVWEAVTVTADPRETAGKTVFKAESQTQKRILKCGGRTCPPMNSVADTAGKPKSRNLSVNWYDMNIREKERQMEQFIGNSKVQSSNSNSPLKYIDVIRSTLTDLDGAQEKRVDDLWNVDGNRNLSDSWTGFTRFTLLNETPPRGYMWSGWRLTKIKTTSRPDHIRPDAWIRIGKAAQRREKQ